MKPAAALAKALRATGLSAHARRGRVTVTASAPVSKEVSGLRAQLTACTKGPLCLACASIRARLRLLAAPKLDLAALPESVPVEHQAKSFGVLWPLHREGAGK